MASPDSSREFHKLKIDSQSWAAALSSYHHSYSNPPPVDPAVARSDQPCGRPAESRSSAIPITAPASASSYSRSRAIPVADSACDLSSPATGARYDGYSTAHSWLRGNQSWTGRPISADVGVPAMAESTRRAGPSAISTHDLSANIPVDRSFRDSTTSSASLLSPSSSSCVAENTANTANNTGFTNPGFSDLHSRQVNGLMSPTSSSGLPSIAPSVPIGRVNGARSFSTNLYREPQLASPGDSIHQSTVPRTQSSSFWGPRRSNTVDGMKSLASYRSRSLRANSSLSPASLFLSKWAGGNNGQAAQPDPDERGQPLMFGGIKYIIGDTIGRGGFSQVKKIHAIENSGTITMAVKIVKKKPGQANDEETNRIQSETEHEISIWRFLKHKHILPLHEVQDTDYAFFCLTDHYEGGSLFDAVRRARQARSAVVRAEAAGEFGPVLAESMPVGLDLEVARNYAHQLALALRYLHNDVGVVHRDMKLENCLVLRKPETDHDVGQVCICDFGMAQYYDDNSMVGYDEPGSYELSMGSRAGMSQQEPPAHSRIDTQAGPSVHYAPVHDARTPPESEPNSEGSPIEPYSPRDMRGGPAVGSQSYSSIPRSLSSVTNATSVTGGTGGAAGATVITGSIPYAAPELVSMTEDTLDRRTDMWAYGVCLYVMVAGRFPFSHAIEAIVLDKIVNQEIEWECVWEALGWSSEIENMVAVDGGECRHEPGVDQQTAREVVRMIKGCLERCPDRRWSIDQVLESGWFEGLEEDD